MKIAFFGTPQFAAYILEGILEFDDINCVCVVSQPDKAVGRKKEYIPTPVKSIAQKYSIELLQPEKIKPSLNSLPKGEMQLHEVLKELDLDFIVVVAYGKIIPKAILDIPKYGCINIHGSILPKYRGASPVQAVLKDGQSETWLTIMYMSEGMDEGDILKIGKIKVNNHDTSLDIFQKFIEIWPELLRNTLNWILSWEIESLPQNPDEASYCGKIVREDGEISFQTQSAQEIYNLYRAYTPWPGIFSWYEGKRFVIEQCCFDDVWEFEENYNWECRPGMFIQIHKKCFWIVCRDNRFLMVQRVKLEGKKSMDIQSFVNGNKDILGYVFK